MRETPPGRWQPAGPDEVDQRNPKMATAGRAAGGAAVRATVRPSTAMDALDPARPAMEIIRVSGALRERGPALACLRAAYRLAAADGAEWLLVDLTEATELAPGGLAAIEDLVAAARRDHRRVFFTGLHPTPVRQLRHLHPSADLAIEAQFRRRRQHVPALADPGGRRRGQGNRSRPEGGRTH